MASTRKEDGVDTNMSAPPDDKETNIDSDNSNSTDTMDEFVSCPELVETLVEREAKKPNVLTRSLTTVSSLILSFEKETDDVSELTPMLGGAKPKNVPRHTALEPKIIILQPGETTVKEEDDFKKQKISVEGNIKFYVIF